MFEKMMDEILRESKTYEELQENLDYILDLIDNIGDNMTRERNWNTKEEEKV